MRVREALLGTVLCLTACGGGPVGGTETGPQDAVVMESSTDTSADATPAMDALDVTVDAVAPDAAVDARVMDAAVDASSDAVADVVRDTFVRPDSASGPARTLTYVFSSLTIDTDETADTPHTGFNLDGRFSEGSDPADCMHPDWWSALDPGENCANPTATGTCPAMDPGCRMGERGCRGGVDNQMPSFTNTIDGTAMSDIRGGIAQDIRTHRFVWIARVTDVNGDPGPDLWDDSVTVKLYLGYPAFATDCGTMTADREYRIARTSLVSGSSDIEQALHVLTGRIEGGRLRVSRTEPFELVGVRFMRDRVRLPLRSGRMAVTLGADRTGTDGNLGGYSLGSEFVDAFDRALPGYRVLIETFVGTLVDVQVENICVDRSMRPVRFGGIGLGFGFRWISARLASDPIADMATTGNCGG